VDTSAPQTTTTPTATAPAKPNANPRGQVSTVESARAHKATLTQRHTALTATRRVAAALGVDARTTNRSSLSDGELLAAGALLLLFVAAAASVLRLSARMAGDVPAGRFG
jgi:hypothetical protein